MRSSLRLSWAPLVLALAACGSGGRLDAAAAQLARGQLDQAAVSLEGVSGRRAESLRMQLTQARLHRHDRQQELEVFRATRGDKDQAELLEELREMQRGEQDPVVLGWVEREMSTTVDWVAERRAGKHKKADLRRGRDSTARTARASQSPSTEPAPQESLLDAVLRDVQRETQARQWGRALTALEMAVSDLPEARERLATLRDEVSELALTEVQELLADAEATEARDGIPAASEFLQRESERFPEGVRFDALHDEQQRLEARAAIVERLAAEDAREAPATKGELWEELEAEYGEQDSESLARVAERREAKGELAVAEVLFQQAAERDFDGWDAIWKARAYCCGRRLALRRHLIARAAEDAQLFGDLAQSIDEDGLTVDGRTQAWGELEFDQLEALTKRTELDSELRISLACEKLARGLSDGPRGGLADLARMSERGWLGPGEAWGLVAWQRGEQIPKGGYSFGRGRWVSNMQLLEQRLGDELKDLRRALAKARGPQSLEEAYLAMRALAEREPLAKTALAGELGDLWEEAMRQATRSKSLRQIERLAEKRRELDAARGAALDLIFDQKRYFYPYTQPAVSSEQARLYPPVQREVDELVASVRDIWECGASAALGKDFSAALTRIEWLQSLPEARTLELALPEDAPEWLPGVDPTLDELDLTSFAWDQSERERLRADREIVAFNEHLWGRMEGIKDDTFPASGEREQVAITNTYRRMMGRRAVAWNRRLQESAQWHSDYMSTTGNFGHFEEDQPERRTPADRMKLAGYKRGASENCHMGSGSPRGAHDGWLRSSGHHRNILGRGHREMASAVSGRYWTQNFGTDNSFEAELRAWRN